MILKKRDPQVAAAADTGVAYGFASLISLLGGAGVVYKPQLATDLDKGDFVRIGATKRSALHLQSLLGITAKEMSVLLDMSYRTFQRKGADDKLGLSSTEQLLEIAEVVEHALHIFHHPQDVVAWLNTPLVGIGGRKPFDLLDNSFGIRVVRQALGRLEHGIFS